MLLLSCITLLYCGCLSPSFARLGVIAHLVHQIGASMVSCVFANDAKEYLVVGTAYVREDVSGQRK